MSKKWTMKEALVLIRKMQPGVKRFGFYLTLAGDVLNDGYSETNLDIIAVPKPNTISDTLLITYLTSVFTLVKPPSIKKVMKIYTFEYKGKHIDIAAINVK